MFTGLVETMGVLLGRRHAQGGSVLSVGHDPWDTPLRQGESVCVQGACLTVVDPGERSFSCDVLDETLARTNLGTKRPGDPLNLERAMRADGRFGGHMVSGHVDGSGTVAAIEQAGRDAVVTVRCDEAILREIVSKGSVTVDGVSLTILALESDAFSVGIIPSTWDGTTIGGLSVGDAVNLETDVLGKYVRRYLEQTAAARPLTMDDLRGAGFA